MTELGLTTIAGFASKSTNGNDNYLSFHYTYFSNK